MPAVVVAALDKASALGGESEASKLVLIADLGDADFDVFDGGVIAFSGTSIDLGDSAAWVDTVRYGLGLARVVGRTQGGCAPDAAPAVQDGVSVNGQGSALQLVFDAAGLGRESGRGCERGEAGEGDDGDESFIVWDEEVVVGE
jgi:hypothetical protein